jgi:hypothetical protein
MTHLRRLNEAWVMAAPSVARFAFGVFWYGMLAVTFYAGGLKFFLGFALAAILAALRGK